MVPMQKKTLVLMAALPLDSPAERDTDFALGSGPGKTIIAARAFGSLDELIAMLPTRPEVTLVHLTDERRTSRVELVRCCQQIAPLMAAHQQRPWVCFANPGLNFLSVNFVKHRVPIRTVTSEVAAVVVWMRMLSERALAR